MSIIISDRYGNRRKISNEPDRINLILNISGNKKNISSKPDNINSVISVPRSKIPIHDKKKSLLPTKLLSTKNIKAKSSKVTEKPTNKPLEKQTDKPLDKPLEKQADKPLDKPLVDITTQLKEI